MKPTITRQSGFIYLNYGSRLSIRLGRFLGGADICEVVIKTPHDIYIEEAVYPAEIVTAAIRDAKKYKSYFFKNAGNITATSMVEELNKLCQDQKG